METLILRTMAIHNFKDVLKVIFKRIKMSDISPKMLERDGSSLESLRQNL